MDDLDFSRAGGPLKPASPARQPQAPLYVPEIARAFFESAGREEAVAAGTVFFTENEKASRLLLRRDKMYLLLEGEVALSARGKALGAVKVGHTFGEMAAISDSPRSATAVARSACRVIALDDKQFYRALQKTPQFALMMLGVMIQRLRGMTASFSGLPSGKPREARVFDKKLMASLVDQAPRSADATAETDCVLLAINRKLFLDLVKSEPAFGITLLSATAERLRDTAAGTN